ncbi:TonB-linked SusC/RagA family outer membrane protein [Flavobacteriaceae bacterium MAR_2009_75]|nr:TonB-linked SusC/RagA family outer membrane protein [Flavobacteriaceae bacterium MAR_2009_75]
MNQKLKCNSPCAYGLVKKKIRIAPFWSFLFLLFFQFQSFAIPDLDTEIPPQDLSVSGSVLDNAGFPLPGASVVEKGTDNGTQTDFDGNFVLNLSDEDAVLVVTYIGFSAKEVVVKGQDEVEVVLEENVSSLEEIVVVGYGTQSKKDITGSISVVDGDDVTSRSVTNVSNALQGAVSGVSVTRSSGSPGAGNTINIRGITTLQGDSSPLILVDDVPVDDINDVNPDQIESISVLKDGASSSLYGSRAAAGVIIITTKRGKEGLYNVSYSGEMIINTPTENRENVSVVRYFEMDNEKAWNDNANTGVEDPTWSSDYIANYNANHSNSPDQYPDTDWKNLILNKSAYGYRHNIAVSGGSERIKSSFTMGYEYQDALYKNSDWNRYTARINNDIKISDKIGANIDFALKLTTNNNPVVDPTDLALNSGPNYPAVWEDGRLASGKSGENAYAVLQSGGFQTSESYLFYGKVGAYYKPIESLKLSVNVAPNFNFNKYKFFNKAIPYWDYDDPNQTGVPNYISGHNNSQNYLLENRTIDKTLTTQALVNYDKQFGDHSVSGVLGYEEFSADYETLSVRGNEFVSAEYPYLSQAPVDGVFDNGSTISENAYSSYFGRLAYDYNDTYYLQANVRRDGSSRFGKDYRWGSFPSISAGWVLSNEKFMSSLSETVSFLKFRASYGSLGNDRLGNYLYLSVLQFSNALIANGNDVEAVRSAAQRFLAVEDVTWETTISKNVGIDLSMFNSALSLTADYYIKDTEDMLLNLSIPSLIGYEDPTVNVGSMKTEGWEMALSYKNSIGNFNYSVSANIFDSKSTVGDISDKRLISGNVISEEGEEFQSWYGYVSDGIYQSQEEIDNSAVTSASVMPGDVRYKDISGPDGVPDGIINELDKQHLGGSLPRYQYGGTINLKYKNFDFGVTAQGVGKQKFYLSQNYIRPFLFNWQAVNSIYDNNYYSNYNTPEQNMNAEYPRLSESSSSNNYRFSDFWLKNGAYTRIKNITLGYTLPSDFMQSSPFTSLRVYASGNDLFSFDSLPDGIDPEQQSGYLITKSFILGLKANF